MSKWRCFDFWSKTYAMSSLAFWSKLTQCQGSVLSSYLQWSCPRCPISEKKCDFCNIFISVTYFHICNIFIFVCLHVVINGKGVTLCVGIGWWSLWDDQYDHHIGDQYWWSIWWWYSMRTCHWAPLQVYNSTSELFWSSSRQWP